MNETIYVIFKVQFDFALEVWFNIDDLDIKKNCTVCNEIGDFVGLLEFTGMGLKYSKWIVFKILEYL